jgi:hypothetical protein
LGYVKIGKHPVDIFEIEVGGVLRVWPEVLDGYNDQLCDGRREQTCLQFPVNANSHGSRENDMRTHKDKNNPCICSPAFDDLVVLFLCLL